MRNSKQYIDNIMRDLPELRLALISTYSRMSGIIQRLTRDTKIHFTNIHAHFDEAVRIAKEIEDDVDIILTRGGTGHFIEEAVSIPVVIVPISPFDVSMSISKMSDEVKHVGCTNYFYPIWGCNSLEHHFDKKISTYTFMDLDSLKSSIACAKMDGCQIILGGANCCKYAAELGIEAEEIVSGEDSVFNAIISGIEIHKAKLEEKKERTRLEAAFNSLNEGIAINDDNGEYTLFNSSGRQLFKIGDQDFKGVTIDEFSIGPRCNDSFENKVEATDYVQSIYGKDINTNHYPIFIDEDFIGMVSTFEDVTKIQFLESQIRRQQSKRGFSTKYTFDDILGKSPIILKTIDTARTYALSDAAVFLSGESGVGKELFAHSIHSSSDRSSGPFVAINCAAIPENLLESELFGYTPGAFTGASKTGKAGLFECAHNGTLFLDEIGEMPKHLQPRLLRALQEKEVMRIGDDKIIPVNCRIISASNKNLLQQVKNGDFREDLYYRINVLSVKVPPLRDRPEDIIILARYFFGELNLPSYNMSAAIDCLADFKEYDWPGNIRELNNICQRIVALLGVDNDKSTCIMDVSSPLSYLEKPSKTFSIPNDFKLHDVIEQFRLFCIRLALTDAGNNQSLAAKRLGIGRTTLWKYLKDLNVDEKKII
ncbi:MAG: sigma 54-interacting transcriptional regulator [Lentihominibacter sp.]|jgi:propionate catabolism operon transcriptional regulator